MYSRIAYTGNAVQTNYVITFPYLDEDHIKVYVDDVIQAAYTFPDSTHVLFSVAPAANTNVSIQRFSGSSPLLDFADGAAINEANLDTAFLQALYVAQEAYDALTDSAAGLPIALTDLTDISTIGEQIGQAANAAAVRTLIGSPATAHVHAASDITSATLNTARLGSGTANNVTYLAGDSTWQALASIPMRPAFLLKPEAANFPSTNFPQLLKNVGTNRVDYTLDFDTTTGEGAEWEVLIPTEAVFTGATIEVFSRQAANTTGTAAWTIGCVSTADNEAWDTAVTNTSIAAGTVKGTAGKVLRQTQALDVTGWAAGEVVTVRVTRAVASDNANEDVKFMSAVVRLT